MAKLRGMLNPIVLASWLVTILCGHVSAQTFDPQLNCKRVFEIIENDKNGSSGTIVAIWSFGYLDAKTDLTHAFTRDKLPQILNSINAHCRADNQSYTQAIASFAKAQMDQRPAHEDEGEALVLSFIQPDANPRSITMGLQPTAEDVAAVFKPSLAEKLVPYYQALFSSGHIQPKPGQTRALSVFTTTTNLVRRDPVLEEFPGGYRQVLDHLKLGITVGRFKYVEPGKTHGMAFDGLYHVNGRWVFMPKPWRVLE